MSVIFLVAQTKCLTEGILKEEDLLWLTVHYAGEGAMVQVQADVLIWTHWGAERRKS